MGWLEGLQVGAGLVNSYKANARADEEQAARRTIRERQNRKLAEDDEIRRAGQDALKSMEPQAPMQAPGQAAMPMEAVAEPVGQPQEQPQGPPVAQATPVAPQGSGVQSEESLSMEPVQGSGQAMPAYEEPRNHPPPPGSTIPEGTRIPSMAEMRVGGGQQPGQQPAQPGQPAQQPGQPGSPMPAQATRGDADRVNASMMAQMRKAIELGRLSDALQIHAQSMPLRDALRTDALDEAEQKFRTSGDVAEFVPVFNKYVSMGTQIKSLTKEKDGSYKMVGRTDEGKGFEQNLSPKQMDDYLEYMRSPKAARAMEAKRAQDLATAATKQREQAQKDRYQNVPAGGTLVDTQKGSSFTAPDKADKDSFSLTTSKDDDGNVTVLRLNKATGETSPVITGRDASGNKQPKSVVDMQKEATNAVLKLNEVGSDIALMDEGKQQKVTDQVQYAAELVAANYGTDNWSSMSQGKAAGIAKAISDGRARIVQIKVPGQDEPVRGVEYQGRKYLMDPVVTGRGDNGESAFNKNPVVSQSMKKAGSRETDRIQILQTELDRAYELMKTAKTPEQKERQQRTIDDIRRELGDKERKRDGASMKPEPVTQRGAQGLGTTRVHGRIS